MSGLFTWYLLPCLSLAAAVSQVGEASSIPNTNEIVAQPTAMNAKRAVGNSRDGYRESPATIKNARGQIAT